MNISPEFRDMIDTILPISEQDVFFKHLNKPLKKTISLINHKKNYNHKDLDIVQDNNFLLGTTIFQKECPDTVYVDRKDTNIALGKTWQHLTGQFYIQELAASLPANIFKNIAKKYIDIEKELCVLDLCAAPGGKTSQLADYLLSQNIAGTVRGNDVDSKRLGTRSLNIRRCGLYNTVATKIDGSQIGKLFPEQFDAILVDAPCSGEGTGFKSDAAFKRWRQESINNIVGLQHQILSSAIDACKVGGIIIYSTCTINPFENELQLDNILDKYKGKLEILPLPLENKSGGLDTKILQQYKKSISIKSKDLVRCWPHKHNTGGFFVSLLRKTATTGIRKKMKKTKSGPPLPFQYSKQSQKKGLEILLQSFGIELNLERYCLIQSKHSIHLASAYTKNLIQKKIRFQECGIPILRTTGTSYSPEHELAVSLGHLATKNTLEISYQELQDYCLGKDISISKDRISHLNPEKASNNYIILVYNGLGVGVSKIVNGYLKNKFLKR